MKNIPQVGYEIELDTGGQRITQEAIAISLGLNFKTFEKIKGHNLLIRMSKEYYPSTIEFNFIKEEYSLNLHRKIKRFLKFVMKHFGLKVYGNAPSFVGTHIHFFRSNLDRVDTDKILKIVLGFCLENIDDLNKLSLQRIIESHQLWGNYAVQNSIISKILEKELDKQFSYQENSIHRPKYRPVIHSPRARTGKLRSTEIRLIPTEFILNDKLPTLVERLNDMSHIPNEDIGSLYYSLIKHYKGPTKRKK